MIADKPYRDDRDFYGYIMRTRVRYYDEQILREELGPGKNIYKIPAAPKMVIDIGAHIGGTTIRCAKLGAKVLAFEPEEYNYNTLVYNVKRNGVADLVTCIKLGVGKKGKQKLYVHPTMSGTTSSYLTQKGLEESMYQMVDFISIQDVYSQYNISKCDMLKLDCENSEKDILEDLTSELIVKTNQISVEFHDKHVERALSRKLSEWYEPIHMRKHEWVFLKK